MAAPAALTAAVLLGVTAGWDFSLPATVTPLADSGLVWMDHPGKSPLFRHEGHTLRWADLNPQAGVYDFSRPLRLLDEARRHGRKVLFRMRTFQTYEKAPWGEEPTNVPQWVLDRSHPRQADMAAGEDETYPGCVIRIAVPWDGGVRRAHLKFIEAFGQSGIPNHPALLGLYVHGISTSLGEEFWFTRTAFNNLKRQGMTASVLTDCFAERIRAWAKAFGPNAGKLAWVGSGWIDAPDDEWQPYADAGEQLDRLALDAGLGWRGGGIETYNQEFGRQGQSVDTDGYRETDWSHPLVLPGRYFGDENEVYDTSRPWAAFMYRSAVLRALELGMKTLWTDEEAIALDPALSEYFNRTAGKRSSRAPDAWCLLRESICRKGGKTFRIRNMERGLRQRARILPSMQVEDVAYSDPVVRSPMWTDGAGATDFTACVSTCGDGLEFEPDPTFQFTRDEPRDSTLKVTWYADAASWYLSYPDQDGTTIRSPAVHGDGSGRLMTATLSMPAYAGSAITVSASGRSNPRVAFVRLIR